MTDTGQHADPGRAVELFTLALEQLEQARDAVLGADAEVGGFLEQMDVHGAELLEEPQAQVRIGEGVGSFRLPRELGRGGMRFHWQVALVLLALPTRCSRAAGLSMMLSRHTEQEIGLLPSPRPRP